MSLKKPVEVLDRETGQTIMALRGPLDRLLRSRKYATSKEVRDHRIWKAWFVQQAFGVLLPDEPIFGSIVKRIYSHERITD